MYKQLIINVTDHETRVALLEDGTIAELYIDRGDDSDIAGNIYKGKVLRVLPGMQAAFVDIGLNQAAFIYVDDVYSNGYKEYEKLFNDWEICPIIRISNAEFNCTFDEDINGLIKQINAYIAYGI